MRGRIIDMTIGLNRKQRITLEIDGDFSEKYNRLKESELTIEIKKFRKLRSNNANAYAWALINEIGNVVRRDKDLVYEDMLKKYGQSDYVSVKSFVNPAKYFKYYEYEGESELNGIDFTHYRVFKGSGEFDTREMAIFIDGIIGEAQDLEIETDTPEQIEKYKSYWERAER